MGEATDPFAVQQGKAPQEYGPPPVGLAPQALPAPMGEPQAVADGLPTSAWLTLPGAAGEQIAAYDLNKARPYVIIDGVRARSDFSGSAIIPLANGRTAKLKVRSTVPGYPTLKFQGETVYKAPPPPAMTVVAYFTAGIGAVLFGAGFFRVGGALLGLLAAYGAAAWLRTARQKAVPYVVLTAVGALLGTVGVVLLVWRFQQ